MFTDSENIETLIAYNEGKLKLRHDKKWEGKSVIERFKLMHQSEFETGRLRSGRLFSADDFQHAWIRLKKRYSLFLDKSNKSGSGLGSRTRISKALVEVMESVWAKDPAINVDKKQLGSLSGGIGSDEEADESDEYYMKKMEVNNGINELLIFTIFPML